MRGAPAPAARYETLTEMLGAAGPSVFFVDVKERDREVTKAELRQRSRAVAADLVQRGVRRGDRVAIVLPTGPEFVECFYGVLCAGAVPVPLYPPVRLGKLDEYHRRTAAMLSAAQAALVISNERIRRFLGEAVAASAPRLGCVLASGLGGADQVEIPVAADDIALIQFSSGTTHDPKPVALTHHNLLANLASTSARLAQEGTGAPVGVSWLPLYHDMGLIGKLLGAAYIDAPLVLLAPEVFVAAPAVWLRTISRHRGTYSGGPNFAFNLSVDRIRDADLDGVDLSSWRVCLNGAESISAAVQRRFTERFEPFGFDPAVFTPCYGMAEASLAVAFKPAATSFKTLAVEPDVLARTQRVESGPKELVSVGEPLPGVEIEIRDERFAAVPDGHAGTIFVRGPSVMLGYFDRPDLTGQALHDGWLDTGDLGFIHDGELFVCGRKKDTVIIRGANHAPQDFEAALEGLPGVRTGCAVAVGYIPEGQDEEQLGLLVETSGDVAPDLATEITKRVRERTGITAAKVELLAPGTLPRTSSGKLRRSESRNQWLAGALAAPKSVSPIRMMLHAAKGEIAHARAGHARNAAAKTPVDPSMLGE